MSYRHRARQCSPYLFKRVRYRMSRLFGTRLQRSHTLSFVTINGHRFKRLILPDSYHASKIEQNLESFAQSAFFPPFVARYEHEIWVEFIDGSRIQTVDERVVRKVADFYASIYARRSWQVDIDDCPFLHRLYQDLRFLNHVGVLTDRCHQDLSKTVEQLTPQKVWVGFDYTDPVLKNFVISRAEGQLCAVDIEGLADNQLIGMGVAKAEVRWLGSFRAVFFEHLNRSDVPDFQSYFPFVELCFLAKWTKRNFFERKRKKIDPALFNRFSHSS